MLLVCICTLCAGAGLYFAGVSLQLAGILAVATALLLRIGLHLYHRHVMRTAPCLPLHHQHNSNNYRDTGPKGAGILVLQTLKTVVPRGVYLPWRTLETLHSSGNGEAAVKRLESLAEHISVDAQKADISRLIVRSSFALEDDRNMYPGIFSSIGDIPASNSEKLGKAISEVLASLESDAARSYRDSIDAGTDLQGGAILVQEHKIPTVAVTASSYNPVGKRPDEMRIEIHSGNHTPVIAYYNRQFRRMQASKQATGLLAEHHLNEIVRILESAETSFAGPVIIECGLADDILYFYQVRRQHIEAEQVWINQGVADLSPEPLAPLAAEIANGHDCLVTKQCLEAAYTTPLPTDITVKLINHRCYVCFNDLLNLHFKNCKPRMWGSPAQSRIMEDVPASLPGREDVSALRKEQMRHSRSRRIGSILTTYAAQLRRGSSDSNGWRSSMAGMLDSWAENYLKEAEVSRKSLSRLIEDTMTRVIKAAGNPQNGPFMTMEELSTKTIPGHTIIDKRRKDFAREAQIAAHPTLPRPQNHDIDFKADGDMLRLIRLFEGHASGHGFLPEAFDGTIPQNQYILLLPDASIRWQPFLIGAQGVIIAGDRALSHLALQIQELGIPALMGASTENLYSLHGSPLLLADDEPAVRRVKQNQTGIIQ